ncbi:MAG: PilN domain-containing protein [Candidatus Omnitrophota bacterium]|nr:PilN domain-containing protein [Candidatus Omnitrophota bacterium]
MLTINLLPESARKVSPSTVEQFHRTPLMWIAVAGMVTLPLLLFVPLHLRRHRLQQLQATISLLEPKKARVETLQRSLQQLQAQEQAFRGLGAAGEGRWSRRLNTLSRVTPEGIWYTELELEANRGLLIQGSAVEQTGPERGSIARLVHDLKGDADFMAPFKDLQIESLKRVQEADQEIVQFTLTAMMAEEPK